MKMLCVSWLLLVLLIGLASPSTPGPSTPDPSTPGPSTPGSSTPGPSTPGPSTPSPSTPGPSTPGPSNSGTPSSTGSTPTIGGTTQSATTGSNPGSTSSANSGSTPKPGPSTTGAIDADMEEAASYDTCRDLNRTALSGSYETVLVGRFHCSMYVSGERGCDSDPSKIYLLKKGEILKTEVLGDYALGMLLTGSQVCFSWERSITRYLDNFPTDYSSECKDACVSVGPTSSQLTAEYSYTSFTYSGPTSSSYRFLVELPEGSGSGNGNGNGNGMGGNGANSGYSPIGSASLAVPMFLLIVLCAFVVALL